MEPEVHELDVLELWRRPAGQLDTWVVVTVVTACMLSLAVALIGPAVLWRDYGGHHVLHSYAGCLAFRFGIAGLLAAWILVALAPRSSVSRFVRVAVALPIAQAVAIVVAWRVWLLIVPDLPNVEHASKLMTLLPIPAVVIAWCAMLAAIGGLATRRAGEWIHGVVTAALVGLLVLGLWAPVASALWARTSENWMPPPDLDAHAAQCKLACLVLLPPIAIAGAFTVVSLRRPELVHRGRLRLISAAVVLLAAAVASRVGARDAAYIAYLNFIHVLLTAAFVAVAALVAFGAVTRRRHQRMQALLARAPQTGTVVCDRDDQVACIEITSWLRGPRTLSAPFAIETATTSLLVPGAIDVVAQIPAITTQLRAGEAVEVFRRGDRVIVGGFVEPPGDHPFRGSLALVPGPSGLAVAKVGAHDYRFVDLALAMWRPCVALLLIVAAIAVPALAGALAM